MTHIRTLSPKNKIEAVVRFVSIFHREGLSLLNLPGKEYIFYIKKMCIILSYISIVMHFKENAGHFP